MKIFLRVVVLLMVVIACAWPDIVPPPPRGERIKMRIVQDGATLLLVLNAHEEHPQPFTAQELLPYREAQKPPDQREAIHRRKVMRKARSQKNDIFSSQS